MSLLQVTDLKVNFGGIEALKGISFQVEQGQVVTLIGANGAGKSTTCLLYTSSNMNQCPPYDVGVGYTKSLPLYHCKGKIARRGAPGWINCMCGFAGGGPETL